MADLSNLMPVRVLVNDPNETPEQLAKRQEIARSSPYADKSALVSFAASFFEEIERRADQISPVKLDGPIRLDEWNNARAAPRAIVHRWFYEDVGCFIAPGGTGKTTLLLFQLIHIVLGLALFGHEVMAPGPVVLITAEDSRETLIARLRLMCFQLQLTEDQMRVVREDVIITDVSGKGIKLTTVEKDVVMPSPTLDRLVVEIGLLCPSLVVVDPMVSFGVGESRVNDAEQGMIDAARRIRNVAKCGVIYVHHTGKENARNSTLDQYSGRGGSALADGSRTVHVLQRVDADPWTQATGDVLQEAESGFVLARPKITWAEPQPDIYIKRQGYVFTRFALVGASEGAKTVNTINDNKIWQFLKDEFLKDIKHTQNSTEDAKVLPQKATRQAIERLIKDNRLSYEELGTGGRGGARQFLRPIDLPTTT
ncbi:MAG: AAA family ATPase [Sphingomonas sp.]